MVGNLHGTRMSARRCGVVSMVARADSSTRSGARVGRLGRVEVGDPSFELVVGVHAVRPSRGAPTEDRSSAAMAARSASMA